MTKTVCTSLPKENWLNKFKIQYEIVPKITYVQRIKSNTANKVRTTIGHIYSNEILTLIYRQRVQKLHE